MTQVLRSLIDIAFLRRDPGALPASAAILSAAVIAYASVVAAQSWVLYGGDRLAQRVGLDLAFQLAALWLLLFVAQRVHRYRQTLIAVLGTGVLLAPISIALLMLQVPALAGGGVALLVGLVKLAFTVWVVLILAHILRSALDAHVVTGVAIALTLVVVEWMVVRTAFPRAG